MFSITGEHDHTPFGAQGVQLVWGQRPDNALVHISDAERGKKCDCVCPACELGLIAKKGPKHAQHFAHQGGKACAGVRETNAHAWAKKILDAQKTLWIPAGIAQAGKERRQAFKARLFTFARARLEKREGSIIPDVVLTAQNLASEDRELIVEILVTHKCDDDKIGKIRTQGKSAIEIDLSRLKNAETEEIIRDALIGADPGRRAPRKWLFNPNIDLASHRLAEKQAQEIAEHEAEMARLDRERQVARKNKAIKLIQAANSMKIISLASAINDVAQVRQYDRSELIGILINGARGFHVPPYHWQAAVLARVAFPSAVEWYSTFNADDVHREIKDCIAPAFRDLPNELRGDVKRLDPDFLFPHEGISRYLDYLCDQQFLVGEWHGLYRLLEDEAAHIEHRSALIEQRRNRNEWASEHVRAIYDDIPETERAGFSLDRWFHEPIADLGLKLSVIIESGDGWNTFKQLVTVIERMMRGGAPATITLGLPIEQVIFRATERERIESENAERSRREANEKAARDRKHRLTKFAIEGFGPEKARVWLSQLGTDGVTQLDRACENDVAFAEAENGLAIALREWAEREQARQRMETCRKQLEAAARKAFPPDHAKVFLETQNPKIGMSPLSRCTDEVGLNICLALLPGRGSSRNGRAAR